MLHHPSGIQLDVVGTEDGSRGRSCEEHSVCGSVLALDVVVRLRHVQILNGMLALLLCLVFRILTFYTDAGEEEAAVAAYWVTDGIDRCRVGFLPRCCVPKAAEYNGHLAQVVNMCSKSNDSSERRRSYRNRGLVQVAMLTQ